MPKRTAKQIFDRIHDSNKILLVPHQKPDGDTLGALTALVEYLEKIGKPYAAFCATDISPTLSFLPHIEVVSEDPAIWKDTDIDTIIVFDSGDLGYAGVADHMKKITQRVHIINIDHHNTNQFFGDHNLVRLDASSTAEIMFDFFNQHGVDITPNMATSLLTGIINDTGNFSNAATTANAVDVSGKLIAKGAKQKVIIKHLFQDQSIGGLKLWGELLKRLEKHPFLDIVYTYVHQHDIDNHGVTEKEIEGVANFLNNLNEGRARMILKELPDGKVKGSFRTTHDHVDVSAFAGLFGGGGHQKAAGFTVEGPIESALEHIFDAIHQFETSESVA